MDKLACLLFFLFVFVFVFLGVFFFFFLPTHQQAKNDFYVLGFIFVWCVCL